jgi:hypothetical protein
VHKHRNGRNIAKGSNHISTEGKEAPREGIISGHTRCKLEKFSHERIYERVCVPWLLWTRYDPSTKNVVLLEALVWREIIIKHEENPRGILPLSEWSEAIGSEAERDVTMILKVMVGQLFVSNNNALSEKRAIMTSIKDICCFSMYAGLGMFMSTILETSGVTAVRHQRAETRDEGHIRKRPPYSARPVQTRLFAPRAFVKVGIRSGIAYTRVDARRKFYRLEAGERPDSGLCLGETLHACLGKDIRHFVKGRVG